MSLPLFVMKLKHVPFDHYIYVPKQHCMFNSKNTCNCCKHICDSHEASKFNPYNEQCQQHVKLGCVHDCSVVIHTKLSLFFFLVHHNYQVSFDSLEFG